MVTKEIMRIRQWSYSYAMFLSRKFVDTASDIFTISSSHVNTNLSKIPSLHVELLFYYYLNTHQPHLFYHTHNHMYKVSMCNFFNMISDWLILYIHINIYHGSTLASNYIFI